MKRREKLKEVGIKNRTYYYFDDIMWVTDIDFNNLLLDKKSYKKIQNVLVYQILYKTFMVKKSMHIRFDKIDAFIKIYDGIIYLVLLEYSDIYDKIKYLKNGKSGITDNIDRNFARIRIDSYNYLHVEKILIL